jgi:hypothetical protein
MRAATNSAIQEHTTAMKKGRMVRNTALIVASAFCLAVERLPAAEPPSGLLRKIAEREVENSRARENYTYRQSVTIQEFNVHGGVAGQYHEVRDVTYSPSRGRYEEVIEQPRNTLMQIKLTPEDFQDIRNIDPFLLTVDKLFLYEGQYKGEQTMDGEQCFVEYVRPRQILSGQRFFEGTLWVRQSDLSVVRSEGRAEPQIQTTKEQNLFPHFTTIRRQIDGQWFFPVETYSDDTLFFKDWPQRIKIVVHYLNYKRFGAESTVTFGPQTPSQTNPPPANTTQPALPAQRPAPPPPRPH